MKRLREEELIMEDDCVLTKVDYLGEGASGKVWLYSNDHTGEEFACKVIPKPCKQQDMIERLTEVRMLKLLGGHHPNIVKLHHTKEDSDNVYLVFEFCGRQSLLRHVRAKTNGQPMQEDAAAKLFKGIMTGITFCHSRHVLHGDVKPDNVMLKASATDDSVRVKLIDFGLSSVCRPGDVLHSPNVGTKLFQAPEVLHPESGYGIQSDVWSAGIVLYWMLTGGFPVAGAGDFDEKAEEISAGPWMQLSAAAKDLVCKMLCKDVDDRLTASDVLKHKWIKEHTREVSVASRLRMLAHPKKKRRLQHRRRSTLRICNANRSRSLTVH